MKRTKFFTLFLFMSLLSCNNDDSNNSDELSGVYIETSPVQGRTQLIFEDNTVTKYENGSNISDEYNFIIDDNAIWLTPTQSDEPISAQFDFEIINSSTFEIENLYPSIPEDPITYMTFERSE
ncbi:hypothetical protein [Winogradskyella flava]|uniref:hypothetical protein n=1 Tax=Winogradskyella flava TaxID=1884876 RepID=UPI0024931E4D|nr:hypothetical protein [Winogradskyella flava]